MNRALRTLAEDINFLERELSEVSSRLPSLLELLMRDPSLSGRAVPLRELLAVSEPMRFSVNRLALHLDTLDADRAAALSACINLSSVTAATAAVASLLAVVYDALISKKTDTQTARVPAPVIHLSAEPEERKARIRTHASLSGVGIILPMNRSCTPVEVRNE